MVVKKDGFSLIEIIVVMIVLGVLAGVAIPNIFNWIECSHSAEGTSLAETIQNTLQPTVLLKGNPCIGSNFNAAAGYSTAFLYNIIDNIPHTSNFFIGSGAVCDEPSCSASVSCEAVIGSSPSDPGVLWINVDRNLGYPADPNALSNDPCSVGTPPSCFISGCNTAGGQDHKTGESLCMIGTSYQIVGSGLYQGL